MIRPLTVSCITLFLLACGSIVAQTPDGLPPANEGVCDHLTSYTPGLYGLCIAFCEAQDCVPDLEAEDPFEDCHPSSAKLLENYRKLWRQGDPDMPCYQDSCPCWTDEELRIGRIRRVFALALEYPNSQGPVTGVL